MKNIMKILSAAVLCVGMLMPMQANAQELIGNGSFETGDFTSWTMESSSLVVGSFDVLVGGALHSKGGRPTALPAPAPSAGLQSAMSGQGGPSAQALWQDVSIPASAQSASLTFDWCATFLLPGAISDVVRADITSTAAVALTELDGILMPVLRFDGLGGNQACWQASTSDLSAYAGQTVRLRFWASAVTAPVLFSVDNVSVLSTAAPVAAGGGGCALNTQADFDPMLPVLALLALVFLYRRRNGAQI